MQMPAPWCSRAKVRPCRQIHCRKGRRDRFRRRCRRRERVCREQAEALEDDPLVVVHVEGDGRLVLIEVGEQAVDQGHVFSAASLSPPRAFLMAFSCLAFDRTDVGEDELGVDHFDVAERIDRAHVVDDVVILEATHDMDDGIDLADVGEELVAEAFALARAFDQAGNVDKLNRAGSPCWCWRSHAAAPRRSSGTCTTPDVRVDRAERIVCRLRLARARQGVEQCAFTHIGQTYDTSLKHSRRKMEPAPAGATLNRGNKGQSRVARTEGPDSKLDACHTDAVFRSPRHP